MFLFIANIGAEDDRWERAVLHFDNPLVVLSLLFPFIGVEATVQDLASICRAAMSILATSLEFARRGRSSPVKGKRAGSVDTS